MCGGCEVGVVGVGWGCGGGSDWDNDGIIDGISDRFH